MSAQVAKAVTVSIALLAAMVLMPTATAFSPGPTATPSSYVAGASTTYTFGFTLQNQWDLDGRLKVTFPTGFDSSSAAAGTVTCDGTGADGTIALVGTPTATVVTVARSTGAACAIGEAVTVSLSSIENPGAAGTTSSISVETQTAGGGPVETGTASGVAIVAGAAAKLQTLMPGETAAPGTTTGKTGTPTAATAGTAITVTVNAVDANWNKVTTATPTVAITSTDTTATLPADAALASGTGSFSVTFKTAASATVTATDTATTSPLTANTGASTTVNAGAAAKLQALMPGETAAPGTTTGKTGTPTAATAGTAITVTVNAVDANWNKVTTATPTVAITSTDTTATLPADAALASGTGSFSVTFKTAASATVTATDTATTSPLTANTGASTTVNAGAAAKLQALMPGETAAPGTTTGKTGTPTAATAGTAITVTVNAVDANWNKVTSATPTVAITSSDSAATLPANAALVAGTGSFSVTFNTAGTATVTATDAATTLAANTGASTTINAAPSSGGGGGGGGGSQPTGSHGQSVGYNSGSSTSLKTDHTVSIGRGAVASVDVTLQGGSPVFVSVDTRDQQASGLASGFTSTKIWMDITVRADEPLVSAVFTLRPMPLTAVDGRSNDIVVMHSTSSGWVEVPTTVEVLSDGTIQISFTASGFSPFVVAHKAGGTTTPTPSPSPTATVTPTFSPTPTSGTPTPTPSPPDETTPAPGILAGLAIFGLVAVLRRRTR